MTCIFDRRDGRIGLAVFLNAGDPRLEILHDLVLMMDENGVDCLELAVPFPNSITDGATVRRSADRALANGVSLHAVLNFVQHIRPRLEQMKIALLVDWNHSIRSLRLQEFLRLVTDSGSDALLAHGVPPRQRQSYYEAAHALALPIVSTCYAISSPAVLEEAARHGTAYVYLVAHYGRTGVAPALGFRALTPVVAALRELGDVRIAVGFGVIGQSDVQAVRDTGADAAIVGSACVSRIERSLSENLDCCRVLHEFIRGIRGSGTCAPDELARAPTAQIPSVTVLS